jgi:hypothetical protein
MRLIINSFPILPGSAATVTKSGTTPAAATRHHVSVLYQPAVDEGGQNFFHRTAGLGDDGYPGPMQGHLQGPGYRSADENLGSQQVNLTGPLPGIKVDKRLGLTPHLPPLPCFNEHKAGRFVENRGNPSLPIGNRDLHLK